MSFVVHFNGSVFPEVCICWEDVISVVRKTWTSSAWGVPVCVKRDGIEFARVNGSGNVVVLDSALAIVPAPVNSDWPEFWQEIRDNAETRELRENEDSEYWDLFSE